MKDMQTSIRKSQIMKNLQDQGIDPNTVNVDEFLKQENKDFNGEKEDEDSEDESCKYLLC